MIPLPEPCRIVPLSLTEAISRRRSCRAFAPYDVTEQQVSQLTWAAQGITDARSGLRAVPSAGALYPIKMILVHRRGVSLYRPLDHGLETILVGDHRDKLAEATIAHEFVQGAPLSFVLAARYSHLEERYGGRSQRFCQIEVGQIAQNLLLMSTALGLGAVPLGTFEEHEVQRFLQLDREERPLYLVVVGSPADPGVSPAMER